MESDKFNPFSNSTGEIVMPSDSQGLTDGLLTEKDIKANLKTGMDLVSEGLDRAILGDTVKSMMIAEDLNVELPNYIIDFTEIEEIYEFQMEAVDALLHPDGEVTIYAYTRTGLAKLGRGLSATLDRILTVAITELFNSKCKVYRDFEVGKPPQIVSDKDITTMRLGI